MNIEVFERLLNTAENKNLEFKEARNSYSKDELLKYLCALSNAGGGYLVLGATDKVPHQVLGTKAFENINHDEFNLLQPIISQVHVEVSEFTYDDKRVVAFYANPRPLGKIISYDKRYWCRRGESLDILNETEIKNIVISESVDYTAQYCEGASYEDFDDLAIDLLRQGVIGKSASDEAKRAYIAMGKIALLESVGLIVSGKITFACILLVGKQDSINRLAANAEIIFEYRKEPNIIKYTQRKTYKQSILIALENVWKAIFPYIERTDIQVGATITEVLNFPERSVREAILNAICHRDYFNPESVIVKINPDKFEVISPGRLPEGVTPKNIVNKQARRNRLLAEVLEKCGLIERSGIGVDLMIDAAVHLGQDLPTFEEPDNRFVHLTLYGKIDKDFSLFMNSIDREAKRELSIEDLITLDSVRRNIPTSHSNGASIRRLIRNRLIKVDEYDFATLKPKRPIRSKYGYLAVRDYILDEINRSDGVGCSVKYLSSALKIPQEAIKKVLLSLRNEEVIETSRGRGAKWVLVNGNNTFALTDKAPLDTPRGFDERILEVLYKSGTLGLSFAEITSLMKIEENESTIVSKILKQMRSKKIIYSNGKARGTKWYSKPQSTGLGQLNLF
jgi:ATP-dependent DNA helicase RecG